MPELPEVQSTLNVLAPELINKTIQSLIFRTNKLRYPLEPHMPQVVVGLKIKHLERRGKYLILNTLLGSLIIHLGMSGSLKLVGKDAAIGKHDYIDLEIEDKILRFSDPRKFGSWLWIKKQDLLGHKIFANLGQEPLSESFNAQALWELAHYKKTAIKPFLMQNQNLVGIGNIYASEILFAAKISPFAPAMSLNKQKCVVLAQKIKQILQAAIVAGGSSLKDFVTPDGKMGVYGQQLKVYGKTANPCDECQTTIIRQIQAQRATFYCPKCQL